MDYYTLMQRFKKKKNLRIVTIFALDKVLWVKLHKHLQNRSKKSEKSYTNLVVSKSLL